MRHNGLLALLPICATAPVLAREIPLTKRDGPAYTAIVALETKPLEVRVELRRLYQRYADLVLRRREEGWEAGVLGGAVLERPEEALLPARQLEEAVARKEKRVAALRADPSKGGLKEAERDLRSLRRRNSRTKGLAADWSDAVWAELKKEEPEEWSVFDNPRQAPPSHSAAVVCTPPKRHALCLAFDPWNSGQADVFEYNSWNEGSFASRLPPEYFLHYLPEPEKE